MVNRRRKLKKKPAGRGWLPLVGAVAAVLVLAVVLVVRLTSSGNKPQPGSQGQRVIRIVAGGDLNVTDSLVAAGQSGSGFDYTPVFLDVARCFAEADAAVVNLEGNLCGEPYGAATTSAPMALAEALAGAGVDFVQMANSCAINNGILGLKETLENISVSGMEPLGAYADHKSFSKHQGFVLRDIGGVRVALVAFTKGMGGLGLPLGSEHCVNLLYTDYTSTYKKINTDGITQVLDAVAAAEPDVTIALLHWGSENTTTVSPSQKKIVTLLQKNGVDAIVGTHSHQVQNINYNPETGALVAYSLGDFYGDGLPYSILLELEITKDIATGKTMVSGWNYIPIYTLADGDARRVMQIKSAMALYESNHISRVSAADYESMKQALSQIETKIQPLEEKK